MKLIPNLFTIVCTWLSLFSITQIQAQNVNVTFQVDMSNEVVSSDGVHIAGNFQSLAGLGSNWNPGSTNVEDSNGDNVYSITVSIPSGTYEYKFINGDEWGLDESPPSSCSVGNTNNRIITIGNTDLVIPPVPFNDCIGSVTFSVNMKGQNISEKGVHIMGDFQIAAGFTQNWDASSIELTDINNDKTFEINLQLPPGEYEYVYVNGDEVIDAENLSLECAVLGMNGTNNRPINVEPNSSNPPTYCYNTCEVCDPTLDSDFDTYWWNDAVFYELFVRSFNDSDGDGIGDFQGIIERLDYLNDGDPDTKSDLGITAIWLMPMLESPSYHGYDVTDYYSIEPDYGSMEDFEEFLAEAHSRGIKVIIDLVLNHSSSQHPWFTQSASSTNDFREWYVWSDTNPGFDGPWGQNVWHANGGDYFYGLFWGGMPDLNYEHPPVKEEMFNVADFWLDKGVDGYRLDAIKYLIEDGSILENTQGTISLLEEFNDVYKSNNADMFTIGEVWSNTESIIPYVQNDRLDVCFEFELANEILNAVNSGNPTGIAEQMSQISSSYPALQYGTFLTNHDMNRVYNSLGSSDSRIKLAASIYLTLPGIPFIYYGEELNMIGTGAHENIRRPMQWSNDQYAGFSSSNPWYGIGSNYMTNNVETMDADPSSILNHYKKLVHIRNENAPLRKGNYLSVNSEDNVLSYAREYEDELVVVVSNFSSQLINSTLSLAASNLTSGIYFVTDLYNKEALGSITINENGGFDSWQSIGTKFDLRESKILSFTSDNPLNTFDGSQEQVDFIISPNPSSESFVLEIGNVDQLKTEVKVFTPNGQVVFQNEFYDSEIQIVSKEWQKGVYFVEVKRNEKVGVKKLLVI